ncbi:unnamed protein product [Sphagnum tenellum]
MADSSTASVQAVVVQSPRLMRPMWMHSCVGGGGGGGCGDPHFVALNQQTPPCSSSSCGSGNNNNNNNVVPSFAPKTPCEGGTTIAVTNNNHNLCLLQPPSSSCLEKKVVGSGVVATTTTTVVVPDNRVRAPFRLSNGKKSIGESDEKWVQEHLGSTKKRGKRKKVLLEEHEGITHHDMEEEEEEEEEEEDTEEQAPLLRNYHRNYFQQQLQPSVRQDEEEEPQRRRSSDYSCSSTHVGRVPSSEFQGNNNENKVQANILHVPIAADDSLMRQQEDLGNCKPRFHVGFSTTLQQQEEKERQQQQQQQRSQRRSFTASLCPPTTQQDNGGGGTGVFAAKRNVNSICSLRTSQREPEDADHRKSKMVCSSSVVKPPSQSSLVMQEKTVLPGSCCFLSSSSSPQQMLQQQGGGVDPGTPFPLRKEVRQQQQQGLLQELDPGSSSSLLGMRTPQVVEGFSGRIAGGSLYSSPLGIPTPNPVVKSSSSSSVGMMMMECGYHPRGGGKGRRKASWEEEEEEGNMVFVEAGGGSENERESIPLVCSGSSKLHAVPAYSPMPVAKQTVSSSEPSLLLTLNFSPMPPAGSMGLSLKTSTAVLASPEEDWGKMLALSQTPATTLPAVEVESTEHNLLGYQERFIRLQAFLKKCDDDEQDLLQALQSLSAAARSGHAVELETRALGLSLEEVKEMDRLKMLNVMGCGPTSRGQHELGRVPTGPWLPGISTTLESGHQIRTKSSPQLSAPMPAQFAVPHFL